MGQLARLALGSKIHRLVVPNLHMDSEVCRESLRECMLMVQKQDIHQRKLRDVIIRIHEDLFVLKALPFLQWLHRGKVTSDKLVH